jgi:phosphate transport system substrate-binding protein
MTSVPRAALALLVVLGAACSSLGQTRPTADPLAGTYTVKGGGAALDVFNALADGFRVAHPTVRFSFEDIGSAAGFRLAASGDVDFSTASATPAPDLAPQLTLVPVGVSATAVIVNAANPVTALTKTQVRDVFSGAVTDWSAVSSGRGKIRVVIREATSALRSNFDSYFFTGKATYAADAIELNTGDDVTRAVASEAGVIGMVTVTSQLRQDGRVRAIGIDGVAPTHSDILSGRYPVRRSLYLAYRTSGARPAVTAFFAYVQSEEGQHIIDRITTGDRG